MENKSLFKSLFKIIVVGLIVVLFTVDILYLIKNNDKKDLKEDKVENVEKVEPPKVYKASLIAAGDNLIHSSVYKDANKNADYKGYDFKPMYELIKPIVSKYDIAYYNQETILGGTKLGLSDYPTFNSPQEVGDAMMDAGFNLVSLATNHTIDRGEKAVLSSYDYWQKQSSVLTAGSYSSEEERNKVRVKKVNNITYTMLNYTYGTNGIKVPTDKEYLVNVWPTSYSVNDPDKDEKYQSYKETVKEDINRVRDKVDVLIVAMHWGVEYTHVPTNYEKDMAEFLASQGVDIIIGTHPHVVQPVDFIDDTLVIYSLGNFISAQDNAGNYQKLVGLMTSLDITKTVSNGKSSIKIDNVSNELTFTYYKNYRNFKIVPFSNEKIKDVLPNYESIYKKYKKVVQKYDSNMKVVECAK